ncbi:hypothetical protein [Lederbergia galactosidilytica]|uniref:Uncharacterized protein n=1 Tax=Lederbergia galactosidilytica TaxID=217031 RepID=A0A177ZXN7_9BACI|nr:hypothetical protein [Lederbergia galactosidilytica]OAK72696.1 hypothetical protein ABB05_07520 [Lederbergia galactosidilytica]
MIKLEVSTHGSERFEVEVEDYNAESLSEQLNDSDINTVALGDLVISRINVKSVKPVQEEGINY